MSGDDQIKPGLLAPDENDTLVAGKPRPIAIGHSLSSMETADDAPSVSIVDAEQSLPWGAMVDHFRVKRLLGRGGMGEVYLARDTRLGRRVALKVIRADKLGTEHAIDRFFLEARATARFSHPNIVTIHAVGEVSGMPYVALEYLEGEDLAQRMRRESISPTEAMRIGHAVADALAEAHRHGVLHRDLKPGNVMLPRDGRIRVVDFGLAQAVEIERDDSALLDGADVPSHPETGEAGLIGTPAYMAPEQWLDEPCTEATDIWALGILLYELCTGYRPFRGAITGVALAVCSKENAPRLEGSDIPPGLADVVAACLAKQESKRPTAMEAASRLAALLRGDDRTVARVESPFRGLLPFSDRHADFFFGRDAEIMAFVELLRDATVIPVLGPSGAGKSSFVQAGVVPRLREGNRFTVVSVRPGSDPFGALAGRLLGRGHSTTSVPGESATSLVDPKRLLALAETLRATPSRLALELQELAVHESGMVLLFVDQLEELYTLNADEALRESFMEAICSAADDPADPVRVVYTARDDFLGRLAETAAARASLRNLVLLKRPEPAALEDILQRPLDAVGHRYEDPQIVSEMVEAVAGEPAGLALIQFAAHRLWLQRDEEQRVLLRSVYDEMGGVAGALAGHADGIIDALSRPEHRLARELLLRLVTPERTRKVVARDAVLDGLGPDAEWVLDRLVESRLLTVRKGRRDGARIALVELAHESLTRTWGTLAQWIEDSHDDLAFLAEVSVAAEHWERQKHDHALWVAEELADAERWLERASTEVPDRIRAFIDTSARHQSRRLWRRRWLVLGTILALIAVNIYVLRQQRIAEEERITAQVRRSEALREGGFAALREGNVREARAKLRSAVEIADAPAARALWWQLRGESQLWKKTLDSFVYRAPLSPDGRLAAAVASDATVYVIDLQTGGTRGFHGHTDHVRAAAFSPDSRFLVSGGSDTSLRLWDVASARLVKMATVHTKQISDLAYSPDGRYVASASVDGTARLWRMPDLAMVERFTSPPKCVPRSASFDGASTLLALGCTNGRVHLIDLESMVARTPLAPKVGGIQLVRFAPRGSLLAVAAATVEVWDVATGKRLHDLRREVGNTSAIGFDGAGARLAMGIGHVIRVMDVRTGTVGGAFTGHAGTVTGVGFIPGTDHLVSASYDHSVRIWDASIRARTRIQQGHEGPVNAADISHDGQLVASGSHDETVRIWSLETGEKLHLLKHFGVVRGLDMSSRGQVAGHSWAGATARWDAKTGRGQGIISPTSGLNIAYSPDGEKLLTIQYGGVPVLWDIKTNRQLRIFESSGQQAKMVAYGPAGKYIAATYPTEGARVWSTSAASPLRLLPQKHVISADFSPDGERLAVGGVDEVVIWDFKKGEILDRKAMPGRVWQVDYAPDGRRLGAAGSKRVGRIWNLDDGTRVDLVGHRAEINGFSFGPAGRFAVTASDDAAVRLWETATGRSHWRAPILSASPAQLLTHRGWVPLTEGDTVDEAVSWRRAAAARAASGQATAAWACWRTFDGAFELWDVEADRQRFSGPVKGLSRVVATPTGCAGMGDGVVTVDGHGKRHAVDLSGLGRNKAPVALGWGGGRLLVATERQLGQITGGRVQRLASVSPGVTAIAGRSDGAVLLGYADGNVEVSGHDGERKNFILEETPAAPVTAVAFGPSGVVIAGYATGLLGVWGLEAGKRFDGANLHGAVTHLLVDGDALYAATEFGQHIVWSLGDFLSNRCDVLREIWRDIPFAWRGGRAVATPPPADHECALAAP